MHLKKKSDASPPRIHAACNSWCSNWLMAISASSSKSAPRILSSTCWSVLELPASVVPQPLARREASHVRSTFESVPRDAKHGGRFLGLSDFPCMDSLAMKGHGAALCKC